VVERDVAVKASSGALMTAAAAAAGSTPALAGPLAQPPPPVPLSSWQGFYLGASVGASWLHAVQNDTASASEVTIAGGFNYGIMGGSSSAPNGVGWLGGLNLGYDWQSGNFVYGLEGDISWLERDLASSTGTFATTYVAGGTTYSHPGNTFRSSKVDALATFRARFGFDFNGTLPYVTLGLAAGQIKNTFGISSFGESALISQTSWVPGLVVGGGIEHKLNQHWSVRGEIDWIGFERRNLANPLFGTAYGSLTPTVSFANQLVIAKLGLNLRF
jgi:outer membrane immunogenic protein